MKEADALVVVGSSMRRSFSERYGEAVARKLTVIPNGYDGADIDGAGTVPPPDDRFRITYVGTMAGSYDPRAFFQAVRKAIDANVNVELRFVGSVAAEVKAMAGEEGLGDRCTWRDTVGHDEALREMRSAHALLLVIPAGEGEERILTGKLFEYLGMRRPIIGLGPAGGDAAAIINECAAGEMFERGESDRMSAWIVARARDPLASTGNGLHTRYERRGQAGALARIITSVKAG